MLKNILNRKAFFNPGSIIIALLLPTIILLSLPGAVIDVFILLSFISSAILLVIMLENDDPLRVTFLPTVVLLLTTFRLLLSIATTRNIIANEDVGHVIETVGEFVMGGNLISGLLIFVIITIVQFLVVTKGGERVAEVGARFSLDALPGRQMTIDGDLKSGLITGEEAQKLRADLSTENKLFGSLDGAMKFVKGDSIAGILISLVNLFGGIYVGISQFDLSLSESVSKFSVLTIGDGLVSQIPSLLLSMACGVYLTRIKGAEEQSKPFLSQVMTQINSFWRSIMVIGIVVLVLGVLNYELLFTSVLLAICCFAVGIHLKMTSAVKNEGINFVEHQGGTGLFKSIKFVLKDETHHGLVNDNVGKIEASLWGQAVGYPEVIIDTEVDDDIQVFISGILYFRIRFSEAQQVVEIANDDVFYKAEDTATNVGNVVEYYLRKRLVEKYNLQYTSNIIDNLAKLSEVMKNEVDAAMGINRVHDVMKETLKYPEFKLDCVSFFEALIQWSRVDSEPRNWLVRMRTQARYEIAECIYEGAGKINIILLDAETIEAIEGFVSGEFEDVDKLVSMRTDARQTIVNLVQEYKVRPIVVVNDLELSAVKTFFSQVASTITICSHTDVVDQTRIASTKHISLI